MQMSSRNYNRTPDRNEGATTTLVERLGGFFVNTSFYYQFCPVRGCKEVTLLLASYEGDAPQTDRKMVAEMGSRLNVTVMVIEDSEADVVRLEVIRPDGSSQSGTKSWDELLECMHTYQVAHGKASTKKGCLDYDPSPLPKGKWKSDSYAVRLSNEVRAVPGVRHIDTDAVLCCDDCLSPLLVIEASSDGMPGSYRSTVSKSAWMTRKLAARLGAQPMLMQHHLHDDQHEREVFVTVWSSPREMTGSRAEYTWDVLVDDLKRRREAHRSLCSASQS